jgi:hypothetical protein
MTAKMLAAMYPSIGAYDFTSFGGLTAFGNISFMNLSIANRCILLQNTCAYFLRGVEYVVEAKRKQKHQKTIRQLLTFTTTRYCCARVGEYVFHGH